MATQNATPADAQLILQLYDLRREPEMRKARRYCDEQFWPENLEEFRRIAMAWGTQEATWLFQVLGYWEMAASLVLRGALNQELFFDNSHPMYFLYAKIRPYLQEIRNTMDAPDMLGTLEKLIESTPEGRERLRKAEEAVAKWGPEARKHVKATKAA